MRVLLDYGKTGLWAVLPDANLLGVLRLNPAEALADPDRAVRQALAEPIGARPLAEIARGRSDACVVVCDITRPVPNPILLPPILDALADGGIPQDRITILVATGTHRPSAGTELTSILGPEVAGACRAVNHACADSAAQRLLGTSTSGIPVCLDRTYCDAQLKVTVGLIEPHFMAGWSGGRKLIMPGLASLETVQAWHSPRFLEHPRATNGAVDGNPVHMEALAIARMMPPDMIVDVTLDESNRITGVFAGEMETAWLRGVEFAARISCVEVPRPVDVVVTTCAGYPLDATFYQAVKGVVGALPILKPGGAIVIAAECSEGIGGPHFTQMMTETDDLPGFVRAIQRPDWEFVPDQWEVEELAKAAAAAEIYCVCSGIPSQTLAGLFVRPAESVESAVAEALASRGPNAALAVIPRGPYVIPQVASPSG